MSAAKIYHLQMQLELKMVWMKFIYIWMKFIYIYEQLLPSITYPVPLWYTLSNVFHHLPSNVYNIALTISSWYSRFSAGLPDPVKLQSNKS